MVSFKELWGSTSKSAERLTINRAIVIVGFLLAAVVALAVPNHMSEPDDWAYYYAVQNFSHGKLVVDNQVHIQQENEVRQRGGQLIQYVRTADNRWALEKAPGYVFYLVPFEVTGIPRLANVLLVLGVVIVTYLLLKRMRDEKAACIGSLLMLFTPVSLIMLNRSYMDTVAASSFLIIGGGLYIYYCLERNRFSPLHGGTLLFLAFLFASWSVVVRYTNLPVAAIFALHFAVTRFMALLRGGKRNLHFEIPAVVLGIGIPLVILLYYNITVFGSPFDYGYNYSHAPIKFAFQYIGQVDPQGHSIPLKIIQGNLGNMPQALLLGFPLLLIGVPGFGLILYQKITASRGKSPSIKARLDHGSVLPWDILLILVGWFIGVYLLYMLYEWTAPSQMHTRPFIILDRFYLPGLLPVAIVVSLVIGRLPVRFAAAIVLVATLIGLSLYLQSAVSNNPNIVPRPVPVAPQQTPSLPLPQLGQEAIINQTRQEVRIIPTDEKNVRPRFQVLQTWIGLLVNRGYQVNSVLPPERVMSIGNAIKLGNIPQAEKLVDQAYQILEEMVNKS